MLQIFSCDSYADEGLDSFTRRMTRVTKGSVMSNAQIVADGTRECQSAGTAPDSSSSHSLKYTTKQYENVANGQKVPAASARKGGAAW